MAAAGFRLAKASFWSFTWGLGVALGVALGGWLTVVGGAATPGVEALDIGQDLIQLPVMAGAAVFGIHLLGQGVIAVVRRDSTSSDPDGESNKAKESEDE